MASSRSKSAPASSVAAPSAGGLSRLLDASPVAMALIGGDGALLYTNPAFCDLLDCLPLGGSATQLFGFAHPDERVALRLQLERLLRGEAKSYRAEHRVCPVDGEPIWVILAASILPGEGTEPDRLVVQLTDIDLQKRAEQALLYSESRWNSALEGARQGVWDYDLRRDRMFYSRMWRLMRAIPEDEDVGITHESDWLDRIHPDDRDHVRSIARKQGQGVEGFDTLQYRERTRDGRYIWILSRGAPIEWDETGKVVRAVGTDSDITHLKTVEQELAAEKERLRITLQSVADGMISADSRGHVEFMNTAAEQLTGMPAADAKGRPVRDVFRLRSETSGEILDCPVWSCFVEDGPIRVDDDGVLLGHDGAQRDIRCTAAPVHAESGRLAGAVLVFQDVSQSRMLQRQLAHSASHDDLTGLTNRAAFEQALNAAIATSRGTGSVSSLVYIDLDHFKPVNDTAGHAAGDALLRQVAQTIREACRSHDVVARIGGDEFAILLDRCPPAEGRRIAEQIVRAIGALLFTWAGRQHRISASAGLTVIGRDPASPLGFMGEADAACYAAKAEGRARVIAFADMLPSLNRNKR